MQFPFVSEQKLIKDRPCTYNNIDPIDDIYLHSRIFCHKKSMSSLHSPRFKKREVSLLKDRINIFENNNNNSTKSTAGGRKSPSPKKSSFAKRSKFSQKLKNTDLKIKTKNVTFSCFKK